MGIIWVSHGYHLGVICSDSTLHVYLEGEDKGIACTNVPKVRVMWAITWVLHGYHMGVTLVSFQFNMGVIWGPLGLRYFVY